MKKLRLGSRTVTADSKPYIVAEIGVNHEGSLDLARKLIELAKEGGASGAKFQTYKAEKLASKHSPAYWDTEKEPTRSQFQLFKKYDSFGEREYRLLADHCSAVGIDFLSTPFDDDAVEFLDPLVPFHKVASADLTNVPLLRRVGRKKKPVVLSTGASNLAEIEIALRTLREAGCEDIVLMHCVLNYPTANENAHLSMIQGLRRTYPDLLIGYSDHTLPGETMLPLITAHLLGAVVLEKHFTHDKTLPGNDHYHAMDKIDLARFVSAVSLIHELLGPDDMKRPLPEEEPARAHARRSIVLAEDVQAGTPLTQEHLTYKRPGTGISPLHWDEVLGRKLLRDMHGDDVLQWGDLTAQ